MELQIAVAKIRKYATSNSGDTVEVIERPQGGMSAVMADGQSSGRGAKWISTLVVRKVITLLADGVRDGAAARAASDSLYSDREGKVSSTLNIITVDQETQTLVITRNNPSPALLAIQEDIRLLNSPSEVIGTRRGIRPVITEFPLQAGTTVVVFTDGMVHAGERTGEKMDILASMQTLLDCELPSAEFIAESLLNHALKLDRSRPVDDISLVVARITDEQKDEIRRMSVRLPLEG